MEKALLTIYCDQYDFSSLARAFESEINGDSPLSLEIVFADKAEIRRLNAEQRDIDRATDVLSFPTLEGIRDRQIRAEEFPYDIDEEGALFLGSVVICTDIAREQAEEYGHSYKRELFYLAAHGICHLLGYDHIQEQEKAQMREIEERALQRLALARE